MEEVPGLATVVVVLGVASVLRVCGICRRFTVPKKISAKTTQRRPQEDPKKAAPKKTATTKSLPKQAAAKKTTRKKTVRIKEAVSRSSRERVCE